MNYREEAPQIIREFLIYHETIKGHSAKTVNEYYLDLRNFFRYMKVLKGRAADFSSLDEIKIDDVNLDFVASVTLSDIYDYLSYLSRERAQHPNSPDSDLGLNANSRARKIATIRSFYKYLTTKTGKLIDNPVQNLDSPKILKSLPRYLTLDESKQLLAAIDGPNAVRDKTIILIFLSCGIRISELVGLNLQNVRNDHLRVLGKGNKERIVFFGQGLRAQLDEYLNIRRTIPAIDRNALFLSNRRTRITKSTVHALIKKHLNAADLDSSKYSAHKLRHTAATLMLHNGVDVRTLQELLGHEHLNTTEIYTHVENTGLRKAAELSPFSNYNEEDEAEDEEN